MNLHHVKLTTKINSHQHHKQQIRSGTEAWPDKLEEGVMEKIETEMQKEQMCTEVKESCEIWSKGFFPLWKIREATGKEYPTLDPSQKAEIR